MRLPATWLPAPTLQLRSLSYAYMTPPFRYLGCITWPNSSANKNNAALLVCNGGGLRGSFARSERLSSTSAAGSNGEWTVLPLWRSHFPGRGPFSASASMLDSQHAWLD